MTPPATLRCLAHRTARDERGSLSAPLTLALGLGLIVIPIFLLVLTLPTWEMRTIDAHDAARNAVRALVTADTWNNGVTAANQAVTEIATNNGVPVDQITASYTGSLTRGSDVTATVTVTIPDTVIPGIGSFGVRHYTASSTENVDPYRSI